MKARHLFFVLLTVALAAAGLAAWGCGSGTNHGNAGDNTADDDSSASASDACQAFLTACTLSQVSGQDCSYFAALAVDECLSNAVVAYFDCLTQAGCVSSAAWTTCQTSFESAAAACV